MLILVIPVRSFCYFVALVGSGSGADPVRSGTLWPVRIYIRNNLSRTGDGSDLYYIKILIMYVFKERYTLKWSNFVIGYIKNKVPETVPEGSYRVPVQL